MHRADEIRLRHMLDAAQEAIRFAEETTRADLDNNRMLTLSLLKDIEIVGEAARKISKETQDSYPEVPWIDIVSMRHRLIHAYFDVNLDVVWQTVIHDLPVLINSLKEILTKQPPDQ